MAESLYAPLLHWTRWRLRSLTSLECDAQDLVQEAFLGLLCNFHRLAAQPERPVLEAYLRRSVLNRICDGLRRARRERAAAAELTLVDAEPPAAVAALLESERARRARAAWKVLPASDRRLLALRFLCGYSYRRLAGEIGKPTAAAARMATRRALERLARANTADHHAAPTNT